jgi:outer membrane immunogenic protein
LKEIAFLIDKIIVKQQLLSVNTILVPQQGFLNMQHVKTAAVIANVVLALANPASAIAADLGAPSQRAKMTSASEVVTMPAIWRGFYAGATLGANATLFDVRNVGGDKDLSGQSAQLGLLAGYNFSNGPWVWGAEADLSGTGLGRDKTSTVAGLGTLTANGNALGSLRLRGGYAWNDVLLYGTAGLAFTNASFSSSLGGKTDFRTGLALGLGAEWAFDKNWTARVEGLAYAFGTKPDLAGAKCEAGFGTSTVRFGIARRF